MSLALLLALLLRERWPWSLPGRELRAGAVAVLLVSLAHAAWAARAAEIDQAVPLAWGFPRQESPTAAPGRLVYSALAWQRHQGYELQGDVPAAVPPAAHALAPAFSDSGRSLFYEITESGHSRIVELRRDSFQAWSTPGDGNCTTPAPSTSGRALAALCDGRLRVFEAPGRGYLVASVVGNVADPALSPDGARLAFAWKRDGHWRLYQIDRSLQHLAPITAGAADERGPRFSPDGRRLAFSRRVGGRQQLWVRDLATGTERRVTRSPGNDTDPWWSPDGRALYFASDRGRGIFMPAIYRIDLPEGEQGNGRER